MRRAAHLFELHRLFFAHLVKIAAIAERIVRPFDPIAMKPADGVNFGESTNESDCLLVCEAGQPERSESGRIQPFFVRYFARHSPNTKSKVWIEKFCNESQS